MLLRCPDCLSEEAALIDRGRILECGNCGSHFPREEAMVTVADAEALAEDRARCTCSKVLGCPQCFQLADALVGSRVRDSEGRTWTVEAAGEKDGFATVGGGSFWDYARDVEVLKEPAGYQAPG